MERNGFQYATKVWVTGVLLPPILSFAYALTTKERTIYVEELFLVMFFGGIVSMPSWFLLYRATTYINGLQIGMPTTKAVLVFISFILTLLPLFVLNIFFGADFLNFVDLVKKPVFLTYWLSICLGLIIFKLNPVAPTEIENVSNENAEIS